MVGKRSVGRVHMCVAIRLGRGLLAWYSVHGMWWVWWVLKHGDGGKDGHASRNLTGRTTNRSCCTCRDRGRRHVGSNLSGRPSSACRSRGVRNGVISHLCLVKMQERWLRLSRMLWMRWWHWPSKGWRSIGELPLSFHWKSHWELLWRWNRRWIPRNR